MIYVNAAVSMLTVLGLIAIAYAWRHSLRQRDGAAEWFFAASKVMLAIGIGLRLIAWDAVWGIGKDITPVTRELFTAVGGVSINVVSSAIILIGVYLSLKARQLLIPERDRGCYPWFLAWLHPRRLR